MEFGFCAYEDKKEIREIWKECFNDEEQFMDYYFQHKFEPSRILTCRLDNKIISMMSLNTYKVIFNDQSYNISYIVGVATRPEYRKKGFMRKLMIRGLNFSLSQGEVFTLLMPIDSRIYERFGFGFTEEHLTIEANIDSLTISDNFTGNYQIVNEDKVNKLKDIYNNFTSNFYLKTKRDNNDFKRILLEVKSENGEILLFNNGYLIVYYEKDLIRVREIAYENIDGLFCMLSFIKKNYSNKKIIINCNGNSPIRLFLPNIKDNIVKRTPFMMTRIINLKQFIVKNKNLFLNDVSIQVKDPIIAENNITFIVKDGIINYLDIKEPDYSFDIKSFVQVIFGYISLEEAKLINPSNKILENKHFLKNYNFNKDNFFNEYV